MLTVCHTVRHPQGFKHPTRSIRQDLRYQDIQKRSFCNKSKPLVSERLKLHELCYKCDMLVVPGSKSCLRGYYGEDPDFLKKIILPCIAEYPDGNQLPKERFTVKV